MRIFPWYRAIAAAGVTLLSCGDRMPRPEVARETTGGARPVDLLVLRDPVRGLEAAIAPNQGGELSSLRVRFRGQWIELIYRARDYAPVSGWRGKAPFLWPATGRNFAEGMNPVEDQSATGGYDWKGRRYPMPLHGFARSMSWKVEDSGADASGAWARLTLADTPETRRSYPFGFALAVEYRLAGGELDMLYSVTAAGANQEPMFFSIGNHMTLRVPFVAGSDARAMLLETPSTIEYMKTAEGIPTGGSRPRSVSPAVKLADFDARTAVSLGGYENDPWLRLSDPAGLLLSVQHHADSLPSQPVVQFNVWGDPAGGYFSPEPWAGLQDSFVLRKGLVELTPGGTWKWGVRLRPESAGQSGAGDPFSGVWKLNLAKSQLPPPAPRSQIVRIEANAEGIRIREEVTNETGEPLLIRVDAKFDGKDYPITGSTFADAGSYRRVDSHTLSAVAKKAGKVIETETVAVSPDGKTLTAHYTYTDASGKRVSATAVADRESDAGGQAAK